MASQEYKNYAFISYQRRDEKWAEWLQRKLEHYRLPISARKSDPSIPEHVRPIFKDTTDLSGGNLSDVLCNALRSSKYLIVVCSPNAVRSAWVSKEVQSFIDSGRESYIIPFIVAGEPYTESDECFPESLRKLRGEREQLAISVNEMGRDAAVVKVVARMFNLQFDKLWQRFEREKKKHYRLIVLVSLLGTLGAFIISGIIFSQLRDVQKYQARAVAYHAQQLMEEGDSYLAQKLLTEVLPNEHQLITRPYVPEVDYVFRKIAKHNLFKTNSFEMYDKTLSPDGKFLVARKGSNCLNLWDINNGKCYHALGNEPLWSFSYSWDGKYMATCSLRSFSLWQVDSFRCIKHIDTLEDFSFVSLSPDGRYALLSMRDNAFELWDIEKERCIKTFGGHSADVVFSLFSPNGKWIVSMSKDNTVYLWDFNNGNCMKRFEGCTCTANAALFSPDGNFIVMVSDGKTIVWDINGGRYVENQDENTVYKVLFSPRGNYLVSILKDNTIVLWNLEKGICVKKFVMQLSEDTDMVDAAFVDYDEQSIIAVSSFGHVGIYRIENELESRLFCGHSDKVNTIMYSPNGEYIVSASDDMTVRVWDAETRQCLHVLEGHTSRVISAAYSPDGQYIVSVSADSTVCIWNANNGKRIRVSEKLSNHPAMFSKDGRMIVFYHQDQNYKYNFTTMEYKGQNFEYQSGHMYSPNHKYWMSKYNNRFGVEIRSTIRADQIIECYHHRGESQSVAFSPDGKYVASASADGNIYIWYFPSLQELICKVNDKFKNNPLTDSERKKYFLK